ncbi:MAG: hypothetical protein M0P31_19160 [Solirubrobacteraceae bacterium]|nr:hypothetical protein [Solirubrobacteraceae bacterium]
MASVDDVAPGRGGRRVGARCCRVVDGCDLDPNLVPVPELEDRLDDAGASGGLEEVCTLVVRDEHDSLAVPEAREHGTRCPRVVSANDDESRGERIVEYESSERRLGGLCRRGVHCPDRFPREGLT